MKLPRTICLVLSFSALVAEIAFGQMLPPQVNVVNDTRRKIGGDEGMRRCREAVDALRQGNFRAVSVNLAGSDYVVSPLNIPELQSDDIRFVNALVEYADESPRGVRQNWTSMLRELTADENDQFSSSRLADKSDAELLTALVHLRQKIGVLALIHAQLAVTESRQGETPRPAARRLVEQLKALKIVDSDQSAHKEGGLRFRVTLGGGLYQIHDFRSTWRVRSPQAPQPLVMAWHGKRPYFVGALTVDRNPNAKSADQRFQIYFRDLDGPPLLLMEYGPDLPDEAFLLEFAQRFSADGRITDSGFTRLRCEMEAVYAVQAELTPLAAAWSQQVPDPSPELIEEVQKPLQAGKAWKWHPYSRDGAGELNDLHLMTKFPIYLPSDSTSEPPRIVDYQERVFKYGEFPEFLDFLMRNMERREFAFKYGSAGPPTWELLGYVNREVDQMEAEADAPERLEYYHIAVGTGDDRRHVGSFRLVSDPVGTRDRQYLVQYLTRGGLTTLDVMAERPTFEEFRDRVLVCINAWPGPSRRPQTIINSTGMKLAPIPAGEFLMGSPDDEKGRYSDEGPVHRVRITKPFYLGVYEVTQAEYKQIMGEYPPVVQLWPNTSGA